MIMMMKLSPLLVFVASVVVNLKSAVAEDTSSLFFEVEERCMGKAYVLSLFTNANVPIGLAAIPTEPTEDCPIIGMDAHFGVNMAPTKHWAILNGDIDLENSHSIDDTLQYPLAQIEDAFMQAEVTVVGCDTYDAITNNDSHFPLSIMKVLGIHSLSSDLIEWAKSMVVARMHELVHSLEASPNVAVVSGSDQPPQHRRSRFLRTLVADAYDHYIDLVAEKLVIYDMHSVDMTMN